MSNIAKIESLDHEGQGVAHVDGKTIFISNALPYETVKYRSYRRKAAFELADSVEILTASSAREVPECPNYGVCGGCSMQHVAFQTQVAVKQRILEDNLSHIGKVKPEVMLPPIAGPAWGYRHRARMSVKWVAKKESVLVGFHERRAPYILDMHECRILPKHVSDLIDPLREVIAKLSIYNRMPQIEWAVGEHVTVMVFRVMDPMTPEDEVIMRAFIDAHTTEANPLQLWLQPKGPDTVYPFYPEVTHPLTYELVNYGIEMPYHPTEFTQVNPSINEVMVSRAMRLLDPQPGERIADMFCGIGNFTLPIASYDTTVVGIEGSEALVKRAKENAVHNGLADRVEFQVANLFLVTEESVAALGHFDKMLIDPPRDGAFELVKSFKYETMPQRIVYVSCKPATLARDAAVLAGKGYHFTHAGIINMFPHTAHVESIGVFEKMNPEDAAVAHAKEAIRAQAEAEAQAIQDARIKEAKAAKAAAKAEKKALEAAKAQAQAAAEPSQDDTPV